MLFILGWQGHGSEGGHERGKRRGLMKVFQSVISSVCLTLPSSLETYCILPIIKPYAYVTLLHSSKCCYTLFCSIWSSPKTLNHSEYSKLYVTLKTTYQPASFPPWHPHCALHVCSKLMHRCKSQGLPLLLSFSLINTDQQWWRRWIFRIYLSFEFSFLQIHAVHEVIALGLY